MTAEQRQALVNLAKALEQATDCNLFDKLAIDIHPSIINQFCDAIDAAVETWMTA